VPRNNNAESVSMPFDNSIGYVTAVVVLNTFASITGQRVQFTFRDLNGGVAAKRVGDLGRLHNPAGTFFTMLAVDDN
jgi:hypothetical protein